MGRYSLVDQLPVLEMLMYFEVCMVSAGWETDMPRSARV